ncbi:MAG: histidinol dehydrogenase [Cyclobacteriaceae bacterium]
MKIERYENLDQVRGLLKRPTFDHSKIEKVIKPILEKVIRGGDNALKKFALEYDHVELDSLWVSESELAEADTLVNDALKQAILVAKDNIWKFHEAQVQPPLSVDVMDGVTCERRSVPIQKVGLYIPGGTAPLFSTVLMLGIPARIAGCKEVVIATPTDQVGKINPVVLYTANLLGIKRILKLGGAQAIAAMAYGTESVPKVDKIFGPGNQYVTGAKQLVAKDAVAIDMPAGPSEVLVYCDESAKSSFVAADLLSQAEHGVDSQVVLVTNSKKKAEKVLKKIEKQLENLSRADLASKSLGNSIAIIVDSREQALTVINEYAPEHLIINAENADAIVKDVVNAGSVFIGPYTPESAGDYASGTNHTLPTNGWASAYSGVSLDSYLKKITYQKITADGLRKLGPTVELMAAAEQLDAHKNAVTVRLKSLEE